MLLQRVEELEWAISGMSFEHARRRRTTEGRNAFRPDVCGVEREGVVLSAGKDASREKNTSSRRYTVWDRRRAVAKLTAVAMSALETKRRGAFKTRWAPRRAGVFLSKFWRHSGPTGFPRQVAIHKPLPHVWRAARKTLDAPKFRALLARHLRPQKLAPKEYEPPERRTERDGSFVSDSRAVKNAGVVLFARCQHVDLQVRRSGRSVRPRLEGRGLGGLRRLLQGARLDRTRPADRRVAFPGHVARRHSQRGRRQTQGLGLFAARDVRVSDDARHVVRRVGPARAGDAVRRATGREPPELVETEARPVLRRRRVALGLRRRGADAGRAGSAGARVERRAHETLRGRHEVPSAGADRRRIAAPPRPRRRG